MIDHLIYFNMCIVKIHGILSKVTREWHRCFLLSLCFTEQESLENILTFLIIFQLNVECEEPLIMHLLCLYFTYKDKTGVCGLTIVLNGKKKVVSRRQCRNCIKHYHITKPLLVSALMIVFQMSGKQQ